MTAEATAARLAEEKEGDREALAEFLLRLRRTGISDRRILGAFEAVPRRLFVPHDLNGSPYGERALPIECGQTISAPELVALMTSALDVRPEHIVLEIGTGSGYQTAILSMLAAKVYSLDRFRTLVELAELRFRTLKRENITVMVGDGSLGWPANASFDRIMVTAAGPAIPKPLIDQLRPGGIMVMPVGPAEAVQSLLKVEKAADGRISTTALTDVRFVPLIPGKAARL
jgi:protein-L-isoaspartate(D-aspartate) O-methyltransferase